MSAGWIERMVKMLQPRPKKLHKPGKAHPVKCGPWQLATTPLADRDPKTLTHNERRRRRKAGA